MLRIKLILAAIVLFSFILIGCVDFKAKAEYQKGKKLQQKFEYESAIEIYENVVKNYSTKSVWADSAQRAISECRLVLSGIRGKWTVASQYLDKGKYDGASEIFESIFDLGINEELASDVRRKLDEISEAKRIYNKYGKKIKQVRSFIKFYADAVDVLVVLEDKNGKYVKSPGFLTATLIKYRRYKDEVIWRKTKTKEINLDDYHNDVMYWLGMPKEYLCADIIFAFDYKYTVQQLRGEFLQNVYYEVRVEFKIGTKVFKDSYGNYIDILRQTSGT